MRGRLVAPTILTLLVVVGALSMVAAEAATESRGATCTAAQKTQRQAALAAYRKRIGPDRKGYFAHHRSAKLRLAFVLKQQARLATLVRNAACTVAPSESGPAARLTKLRSYVAALTGLGDLFDSGSDKVFAADDAMATISNDEDICDTDPELSDCPVPLSEYQDAAKALRAAAAQLKQGATKLGSGGAPAMAVTDYNAAAKTAAGDCGVELTTVAVLHKKVEDAAGKWTTRLGNWADTYATGKSPNFDAVNFTPGADSVADDLHGALVDWSVMTSFYWSSLVEKAGAKPPPALPTWIGDLRDEQCPPSE